MNHWLILVHRYLGIAVGTLMAMWCLSGAVMMYVSYPVLDEHTRKAALAPIDWNGCCTVLPAALGDADRVSGIQIETLAGRPMLLLTTDESSRLIDLHTGLAVPRISPEQAATVALSHAKVEGRTAPRTLGMMDSDQWTVSGEFASDRPMYKFAVDGPEGTEIYVSSRTGKAVQLTTARGRFWNWLGAVPHWLYFSELRRNPHLWSRIVSATAIVGCFLVITGIYIGVRQLMRSPAGQWSSHRGLNLWHHVAGILFGILALTWVFSGLVSMNPWGWLDGAGARQERARLRGNEPTGGEIKAALQSVANSRPAAVAALNMAPLDGRLYFIASGAGGGRRRLDAAGMPAPLRESDVTFLGKALGGGDLLGRVPQLIWQEDAYYFGHDGAALLPVYRLITADDSAVRYYFDAVSGELVLKVDRNARAYRWLHEGLHRMDFVPALRGRPQWDVLMLLLLSGVATLCVTGAYLGYRRLVRGVRR